MTDFTAIRDGLGAWAGFDHRFVQTAMRFISMSPLTLDLIFDDLRSVLLKESYVSLEDVAIAESFYAATSKLTSNIGH
jgi:hypothetical protein